MPLFLDPQANTFRQSAYFGGGGIGNNYGAPISGAKYSPNKDSERPDTPRAAWAAMSEAAELPDDLLGGNRQMRKKSTLWLPKEVKESIEHYRIRVQRATCFPFYKDALHSLSSKPFATPVLTDGLPAGRFEEFLRDVDGTGKSLTVFCRDWMLIGIHRGMAHVLVDASSPDDTADGVNKRRVFANIIDPLRVLDIKDQTSAGGRVTVTYVRYVQMREEKDGKFGTKQVKTIIELNRGLGEDEGWKKVWTYDDKAGQWFEGPTDVYNPGGDGIPFFTLYTNQVAEYHAEPALEDLAWVNLAHFQSRADHAHVMRVARLITLVLTGWKKDLNRDPKNKGSQEISLGPLSKIENSDPQANAFFLEPNGRSIELSFQDMEQLAKEAQRLGARYLSSGKSHVTAHSVVMDHAKLSNDLHSFCVRMESELQNIFLAAAEWLNMSAPNVQVTINKEFDVNPDMDGAAKALAAVSDVISPNQKVLEAVRHGILRHSFPVEENFAELEEHRTQMNEMFGEGVDVEPEEPDAPAAPEPETEEE